MIYLAKSSDEVFNLLTKERRVRKQNGGQSWDFFRFLHVFDLTK